MSELKRMRADYFLGMSAEEMEKCLTGEFILVFQNGEIKTNAPETTYSGIAWDIHRKYPETPLLVEHHLGHYLSSGKRFSNSIDLAFVSTITQKATEVYHGRVEKEVIWKLAYEICNKEYNVHIIKAAAWVTSIDILDFYQLFHDPEYQAIRTRLTNDLKSTVDVAGAVERAKKEVGKFLMTTVALKENPIVRGCRTGVYNVHQVINCIGPIGIADDIDGTPFPFVIEGGYFEGINKLHQALAISRSASKALALNASSISTTEHLSRCIRLISATFSRLHEGDCGTTMRMGWNINVTPEINDLVLLHGKNFLSEDGEIGMITPNRTDLIGQLVYIRSVFGCMHPDEAGCCEACFGDVSYNIPKGANVAREAISSVGGTITSSVLATKHDNKVTLALNSAMSEIEKAFFKASSNGSEIFLKEELIDKNPVIHLDPMSCEALGNIHHIKDLKEIPLTSFGNFQAIKIMTDDTDLPIVLEVGIGKRMAAPTYYFLEYIKEVTDDSRIPVNSKGEYVIPMATWDSTKPLFQLSSKSTSVLELAKTVENIVVLGTPQTKAGDSSTAIQAALMEFYKAVNARSKQSLSALEAIIYGACIVSATDGDYSLPKPWTKSAMGIGKSIIRNRSLSIGLGFQEQHKLLLDPTIFTQTNRHDSEYDALFLPKEVAQWRNTLLKKGPTIS